MDEDNKTNRGAELTYSRECKLSAVARIQGGESPTVVAQELGVKRTTLYKWVRQVELKGETQAFQNKPGRPFKDDEDELSRLRRENQRLQMENEILKKAQAYFAPRKR